MILLSILLFASIAINILLMWYIRKMLQELFPTSDNVEDLLISTNSFVSHLESIYELEMFYGDSTLEGLIQHSKEVVKDIKDFESIYSLIYDTSREELLIDEEQSGEEEKQ